mmetsp:Transcript_2451/g.3260  ORF Transcript_2451/g.3260 Transcript_2451/m.3260 type:complete len:93 (-) Transcript_2451:1921-2199(-)
MPLLTKGIDGGMRFRDAKMVLLEKNLDEFDLGELGEDGAARDDECTVRLDEDCFHMLKGEREKLLSSALTEAEEEFDALPFSTITNSLSSEF